VPSAESTIAASARTAIEPCAFPLMINNSDHSARMAPEAVKRWTDNAASLERINL